MEPGNGGGLWASGGAVLTALVVAVLVLMMVEFGGGVGRPLMTSSHATTAQATTQATTAQAMGAKTAPSQG